MLPFVSSFNFSSPIIPSFLLYTFDHPFISSIILFLSLFVYSLSGVFLAPYWTVKHNKLFLTGPSESLWNHSVCVCVWDEDRRSHSYSSDSFPCSRLSALSVFCCWTWRCVKSEKLSRLSVSWRPRAPESWCEVCGGLCWSVGLCAGLIGTPEHCGKNWAGKGNWNTWTFLG